MNRFLQPPDSFHVLAAQGWLELGNPLEAEAELEMVTPQLRIHADVLAVRWHIYAARKEWDACLHIGEALVKLVPDRELAWINRSNALHYLGRYQEAYDHLLPALDRFRDNAPIRYNLACFCSRMGRLEESRGWLRMSFDLKDGLKLQMKALDDPDLEPLWKEIAEL